MDIVIVHEHLTKILHKLNELEHYMAVKFDGLNTSVTNLEASQAAVLDEIKTLQDDGSGDQAVADALAGRVDAVTSALNAAVPQPTPPVETPPAS